MKFVELNNLLKAKGLASTGGQAKIMIRSGKVLVNGDAETRVRRKLVPGDRVEAAGQQFTVREEECRQSK
ncbi:RNA-binding S4 domain-containing protein [Candidatus Woesearchaeota archaeon]|nr:RNA-binding S4 domain-containing protein [Candidatus Woesearchaeota archaeon]